MEYETVINESGPATQVECPTCGSIDYYQDEGFFYCSACNTQSQVARLFIEDEYLFQQESQGHQHYGPRVGILRGTKEKQKEETSCGETGVQITSWEVWNVVLKEMADRLIDIGFPGTVRAKIFHIYVSYLMKRKVIFVSTSNPAAPSTITLGEHKRNLQVLYGYKTPRSAVRKKRKVKKKRILFKKQQQTSTDLPIEDDPEMQFLASRAKKATRTMNKRKAIEKEYLATANAAGEDDREFEDMIDQETTHGSQIKAKTTQAKSPHPRYTPLAKRILRSNHSLRPHQFQKQNRLHLLKIGLNKLQIDRFTLSSCFIIVFVALRELGFPVLMTDIMRLHATGILHIDNILELIRKADAYRNVQQSNLDTLVSFPPSSIEHFSDYIENFLKFLEIKKFNYPYIKEIVPKYIDEFVLPREFECLVNLTNDLFSFVDYVVDLKNSANLERYKLVPEIIVLVQLVTILKMLYGLDDETEKFQSNFAKLVNKVIREEIAERNWNMEEWTELFVIEDWFLYLQRRKELVKRELCCPAMYTPNSPVTVTKLQDLISRCKINDDPLDLNPQQMAIKSCQALFEAIANESLGSDVEIPKLKPYIPLPLPTESIVQQYVERYPCVADSSVKPELLKAEFVQKRLDFIWNPKKYVKLLEMKGHKVKIVRGDAINNFPDELKKEVKKNNVVLVFQPYKSFDEFVGGCRQDTSVSMRFLLELCEDLIPDLSPDKVGLKCTEPFFQNLVNAVGDMYIKRILNELVPILTRWDPPDSD